MFVQDDIPLHQTQLQHPVIFLATKLNTDLPRGYSLTSNTMHKRCALTACITLFVRGGQGRSRGRKVKDELKRFQGK